MAEVQVFEPELEVDFTDRGWRAAFAGRTGVVCDTNGSAFNMTRPAEGSTVEIGSPTIPSRLVVDGFGLEVPAGTTQSLSVPASVNGTNGRTDLIVGRLTTGPTDLKLHRIPGTEGSLAVPAASLNATGTRDLPLYAIRRILNQGLNQAIVTDLRPRIGHHYLVPTGGTLPANASLGDIATRGGVGWRYDFVGPSTDWVVESYPRTVLSGTDVATDGDDYDTRPASKLSRDGVKRYMNLISGLAGSPANPNPEVDGERRVGRLAESDRPAASVALAGFAKNTANVARAASGRVDPDGWVIWHWVSSGGLFPTGSTITLTGRWETAA